MDIHKIKSILIDRLVLKKVYIDRDDGEHYRIIVIGDCFINISILNRQKMIYSALSKYILDGRIHSVSIQVFTLVEWEEQCKLDLGC